MNLPLILSIVEGVLATIGLYFLILISLTVASDSGYVVFGETCYGNCVEYLKEKK